MHFFHRSTVEPKPLSSTVSILVGNKFRLESTSVLRNLCIRMYLLLQKMYDRECSRVAKGLARMVPKLRETHIIRDSWTKLNVAPAKIMQVILALYVCDIQV